MIANGLYESRYDVLLFLSTTNIAMVFAVKMLSMFDLMSFEKSSFHLLSFAEGVLSPLKFNSLFGF